MVRQYEIYWCNLNPTQGSEINKTRPAVIISPNESNKHLKTVIVAPLTSTFRKFPMRLNVALAGKEGQAALDQIRCVDKTRLLNKAGELTSLEIQEIKNRLKEYLVD